MIKRDGTSQDGQSEKVKKTLRGRAEKACVRCRAKKRTCDGGNPCLRCKESHSACYFSDWHYTVPYPREYVEYLEEQQEQLSTGLLAMYRMLKASDTQSFSTLSENPEAQDVLAALKELRRDRKGVHLGRPSRSTVAGGLVKDSLHLQVHEVPISPQNEYSHGSRHSRTTHPTTSPLQSSSVYMPQVESAHSNITSVPTPAHHSYPAAPYLFFEFVPHMQMHVHPQSMAAQTQPLPQDELAHHNFLSSRNGMIQMPDPWRPSPSSLTPSATTPLGSGSDHHSPFPGSPGTYSSDPNQENMHMHQNTFTMVEQPPWNWGGEADMNFHPHS